MTVREFDVVLRLRRDNDYNYEKTQDTFVPAKGEVCLIDTAQNGLRAKIGDGVTTFKELHFADEDIAINVIVRGYLFNDQFYSDAELTIPVEASANKIYIDAVKSSVYIYDGSQYVSITQTATAATASTAGIMKLYDALGQNTDGTMTQKVITDELGKKVEIETTPESELLTFLTD